MVKNDINRKKAEESWGIHQDRQLILTNDHLATVLHYCEVGP
jgi:hypothetical protein